MRVFEVVVCVCFSNEHFTPKKDSFPSHDENIRISKATVRWIIPIVRVQTCYLSPSVVSKRVYEIVLCLHWLVLGDKR